MAEADFVPSANPALITGATSNPFTKRFPAIGRYFVDQASSDPTPLSSNIWALCYGTAVLLLGWFPWNALLILLLVVCRHKRSRFHAFDAVPSQEPMRSLVSYKSGSSL